MSIGEGTIGVSLILAQDLPDCYRSGYPRPLPENDSFSEVGPWATRSSGLVYAIGGEPDRRINTRSQRRSASIASRHTAHTSSRLRCSGDAPITASSISLVERTPSTSPKNRSAGFEQALAVHELGESLRLAALGAPASSRLPGDVGVKPTSLRSRAIQPLGFTVFITFYNFCCLRRIGLVPL